MKRDFLTLLDFSPEELQHITQRALTLKTQADPLRHTPLLGKTAVLIFQLNSTRTRVAFDTGMSQLGGHTIMLSTEDSQLGRGEPIEDTARVLAEPMQNYFATE